MVKQVRKGLLVFLMLFLCSFCTSLAVELVIEPFESTEGMRLARQNNGTGTFELSSEIVKNGNYSLKLVYDLPPGDYGYSNVELIFDKPLLTTFGKIGLWVYGNQTNNQLLLRVMDSSGEVFQYKLPNLNWGEQWRWCEVDLADFYHNWGGNNNRVIDGPAQVRSILVGATPFEGGTVYFDDLTFKVTGGGTITGTISDQLTQLPVENVRVSLSENPSVSTRTDEDGQFVLYVLPGSYNLLIGGAGYEQQTIPVTIEADKDLPITCSLFPAPDTGVYSDKANDAEQGLKLLSGVHGQSWKGEIVEIGGRNAVRMNRAFGTLYLFYDVNDDYIFGGNNQVYITIEYFDNGNGLIGLQYDSPSTLAKLAGTITRTNTNTWKEATIFLPDAVFENQNGRVPGDFRLGIWIPGAGYQDDAYIGKVSIVKQGRIALIDITPSIISPTQGGVITVSYRLTSTGIVSAWVEDPQGNYVVSLGDEREGVEGYFTWAGRNQDGEPVEDGVYYIKLASSGLAWGGVSEFIYKVEILTAKPKAPSLDGVGPIQVNEPEVLVKARASAGANVRAYLNDQKIAERNADAQGKVVFKLEQLAVGKNNVHFTVVDQAGNESDPSSELLVLYDPILPVGQITLSQSELAPPAQITIRFYVAGTRTLEVIVTDGDELSILLGTLINVSEVQTLNWDGTDGEKALPDGSYIIEIYEGSTKRAWTVLQINAAIPEEPILLLPSNHGRLSSGKVRFSWEKARTASFYRLKIWQDQTEYTYETYLTSHELSSPLTIGVWNWQVEAVTAAGISHLSEIGTFIIDPKLPTVFEVCNVQAGPNPFAPNGNGRFEQFHLYYSLTQDAVVRIDIYNLAGALVFHREEMPESAGDHVFVWDGRDQQGRLVQRGNYVLFVLAKNEQNRAPSGARKLISVLY